MHVLMCAGNRFTSLPELPSTMQYLDCNTNLLRILPPLPEGLVTLGCEKNPLETFPEFPLNLSSLTCDHPISNELLEVKHMTSERVQQLNQEIREGMKLLTQESKDRCEGRCKEYKEEIMMRTWHPSRIEKLLEMGYDIDDM